MDDIEERSFMFVKLNGLSFGYNSATTNLFTDISLSFPLGWTGVVGANGTGKSTLLKLISKILPPDSGEISGASYVLYCPQRTDDPPEGFAKFLFDFSKSAFKLRDKLHIKDDWDTRWSTLSHGERKRAQIGTAIYSAPDVLAIDEPTNHLDGQAQSMLNSALRNFKGIGILVSHDRNLLDDLCTQTLFIDPPNVICRPGGVTTGLGIEEQEQISLGKKRSQLRKKFKKLNQEANKRRAESQQADKRRSKKGLAKNDSDGRAKKDLARVTGKDASAGNRLRQLEGRLKFAESDMNSIHTKKNHTKSIWIDAEYSKRNYLLELSPTEVALNDGKKLYLPSLSIFPQSRIALLGPNGTGKSTLIERLVLPKLNFEKGKILYIPQEILIQNSQSLINEIKTINPKQLGQLMIIVSCLGSDPHRILESTSPSPGEVRKLLIALGISKKPHILIMDEPTNHLDMPSIQCLEDALIDCPCAMLLVSHDERFLNRLTNTKWNIEPENGAHDAVTFRMKVT